jgi:G6PDH family F420-dependent oxidoreductase
MIKLGYKLMSEEHGPIDLVRNANRAEQAGFDFAAISDHFFPWIEEQGHSPFAWSVLGALANATRQVGLTTAVTCPIMRYDPVIIAQGTATLGLLSDNRFTLALGAGERLNEHIVGEGWPGRGERHERLSEAVDIIQGLLAGTLTNYRGNYFVLDDARSIRPASCQAPCSDCCRRRQSGPHRRQKGGWPNCH